MTQLAATSVTAYFTQRDAAITASGSTSTPLPDFNFAQGTVAIGDGNGAVPPLSTLLGQNGLVNARASGQWVTAVNIDSANASQIDITINIPNMVNGVELGGFTITEFAVSDELGQWCLFGTTNVPMLLSTEGQVTTVAIVASILISSTANAVISPPSAGFITEAVMEAAINAHLPTATAPLTQTDTTDAQGWDHRVFGLQAASQPVADPPSAAQDAAAWGYGRAATQTEFNNGAPTAGRFAWPWPTLQQVKAAIASLLTLLEVLPG